MNESTKIHDALEPLHLEEYARRLKVGRTTIFKWKQEGVLIPGRHFIKRGKVVRYIWAFDLIMELHENAINKAKNTGLQDIDYMTKKRRLKNKIAINLGY